MTSTQTVLDAVAERLESEPAVVLPVLRLIAGIDALPADHEALSDTARAVSAERITARRESFRAHAFDSAQVRGILGGISRQAVSQRVAHGSLLACEIAGRWHFPDWQFTDDGLAPGLPEVLTALRRAGIGPLAADLLMRTPLPEEDGARPADLLRRGEVDRALHYVTALAAGF